MSLVAGVVNFPVPAGLDVSLGSSEDIVCQMELQGWGDLAVVLRRNLAISWGLCAVNALLLMLCVREVLNFDWWETERIAEGVPAQDRVVAEEMDCFGDSIAK